MLARHALKALLLTFILLPGSLLPGGLISTGQANDSDGYTTLYFTNALGFESEEDLASLAQNPPTSETDSKYPPSILAKEGLLSKNTTIISEEWLAWVMFAALGQLFENLTGAYGGIEGIELLFPGPNRITESYMYDGNDTIHIQGDVLFNLYFSDTRKIKTRTDSVSVALYVQSLESFLPKRLKNTTILLAPPKPLGGIYNQQIILSDIDYILKPGDSLLCSIEIIPTNKSMIALNVLNNPSVQKIIQRMVNRWENNITLGPIRRKLGALIKDTRAQLNESGDEFGLNFTLEDIASILNAMKSTKIIYDSKYHPSSVTLPARITENDMRIYYLTSDQTISEVQNEGTNASKPTKLTATPLIWTMEQGLERDKILKVNEVSAELYFSRFLCLLPPKVSINVSLYDENRTIASTEKVITRKELQGFLRKKMTPIIFNFTGLEQEITYGHRLGVGISISNAKSLMVTAPKIHYGSPQTPSLLRVTFEETDNIQIQDLITTPPDGTIIPGGTVQYLLNVTSTKADTLQLRAIEREKTGDWSISLPAAVTVAANSWTLIPLIVNSSSVLKEAYGSYIDLLVVVTGKTGIDRTVVIAEISEAAIHYRVEILGYSNSININKGGSHFFYFIIKNNNTGAIDDVDSYSITATSKNNWLVTPRDSIRNLGIGKSTNPTDAKVFIEVPKNTTLQSDLITITISSDSDSSTTATITVTVNVIGGGVIEDFLEFFDSAARSLGLNDVFGSDAKYVLLILLVTMIIFLLIIIALVSTIKPVQLICQDRIKEIESTEKAVFEITLRNLSKKTQTFEITATQNKPSPKWSITVEPLTTAIEGRQTQTVQVVVLPTEGAESKDWTQVTVLVKKTGRKNTQSLSLMTMMKEGKTLLQLQNVSHWPTMFNPGEKVITSFSLSNIGSISARNVKVFFYLNGKQKNMVQLTLPAGNVADIQMPWLAEKGKNRIRIRVKE
ncbi:MAG: hypothetical protein JW840_09385 [Candidatus Thermoplasmatota archaeon]|nr:hypothetical protein [Candidatus Thermoplasmatota archaeon]